MNNTVLASGGNESLSLVVPDLTPPGGGGGSGGSGSSGGGGRSGGNGGGNSGRNGSRNRTGDEGGRGDGDDGAGIGRGIKVDDTLFFPMHVLPHSELQIEFDDASITIVALMCLISRLIQVVLIFFSV